MSQKDISDRFFLVKEFSQFVDTSISKLHYYDRVGVFQPDKRGEGLERDYRYYSSRQITTVKMVLFLAEIGVTLEKIKELSEDRNPAQLIKLLSISRFEVVKKIRYYQELHSVINVRTDLINEGLSVTETEISLCEMPGKQIILGNENDYSGTTSFYREFIRFCNEPHVPKLNKSFPIGAYWESMTEFIDMPSRPIRFFSIDPKGHEQKPEGLYLNGYTRGYYLQF